MPLETAHQRKIAPWSNKAIQKLSRKKRKMWDKYKKSYSNEHYNLYKEILNQFNEEKYDAVKKFENNIISNKKTNPKRYYKYVSKKDKYLDRKISLKQNNVIIENNDKCAEILNNYFSSVFTSGQSEIVNDLSAFPFVPDIEDVFITEEKINEKIQNLNVNKSTGPDGIPALLIKNNSEFFTPILTKIFRRSYNECVIPNALKTAHVIPLHKSGDKTSPNNYRPVKLTPIIANIFEF